MLKFFATGADKPQLMDGGKIQRVFTNRRRRVFIWLVIGYGFFHTCQLSPAVAKNPMLDEGIMPVEQMGIIGSLLLFVYAFGKFFNGFLADRANIRRFMSVALLLSAFANLAFGATNQFWIFAALWVFNGWFQSVGSTPSVVSICQWFSNKERGTRHGLWAGAHNIVRRTDLRRHRISGQCAWLAVGVLGLQPDCIVIALIMYLNLSDRSQTYGLSSVADYKQDHSGGDKPSSDCVSKMQWLVPKSPIVWILGLSRR